MTQWDEVTALFERQQKAGRFPGGQLVAREMLQRYTQGPTAFDRSDRIPLR